ncbi:hypothetical protein DL1_11375 [Thioclava dalianensis]|uniref:Uncharacterized protein n=1 Tax=Thioclava dalianensis TaxID=1185766 RepID=A0A074TEB5_9RHOB|nr:hypothetical protein [Thioclava dalianensis]KEP68520.1 hypothetical protein DL1_11375 [Thioclava dalianensis]SFN84277.1 hypothetical protein SAMN05216224_11723 [Thioclava dalianensis]
MSRLQAHLCKALGAILRGQRATIPEAGQHLLSAFLDLSRARRHHAGGPEAISYPEIEAYCRMMRVPLEPHHVAIIVAMDSVWMEWAMSRSRTPTEGTKTLPPLSKQGITAELFDAAFM